MWQLDRQKLRKQVKCWKRFHFTIFFFRKTVLVGNWKRRFLRVQVLKKNPWRSLLDDGSLPPHCKEILREFGHAPDVKKILFINTRIYCREQSPTWKRTSCEIGPVWSFVGQSRLSVCLEYMMDFWINDPPLHDLLGPFIYEKEPLCKAWLKL